MSRKRLNLCILRNLVIASTLAIIAVILVITDIVLLIIHGRR